MFAIEKCICSLFNLVARAIRKYAEIMKVCSPDITKQCLFKDIYFSQFKKKWTLPSECVN